MEMLLNALVPDPPKEKGINVGIPESVYWPLRDFCKRRRLVMKDIVGDVMKWFLRQPEAVRSVVADAIDAGMEVAYAEYLEREARRLREQAVLNDPDIGESGESGGGATGPSRGQGPLATPDTGGSSRVGPHDVKGQDGPRDARKRK